MLINCLESEESRIAVVEDGVLEEFYLERAARETLVGNIYKGRVLNVLPGLAAAFVDIGLAHNGFLHASEVAPLFRPPDDRNGDGSALDDPSGGEEEGRVVRPVGR
ncbi:MAG: S1 RNA-binding domain-containing protein, partial [Planctomycetes bacterium]|nr:S1 RNA-binding domain-containing protein [Planctomycetota bacterium]